MQQPTISDGPQTKSTLTMAAHWLSAIAVLLGFAIAWLRELFDDETIRNVLINFHRQLGLFVLLFLVVRLIGRWQDNTPAQPQPMPWPMRWAAAASHGLLYVSLLAMPVLGWCMTNAQGRPVRLFGMLPLPTLVNTNPDLADDLQTWHEIGSWLLLSLVCLHILAALWHHWVRRDDMLTRMLPLLKPKTRTDSAR